MHHEISGRQILPEPASRTPLAVELKLMMGSFGGELRGCYFGEISIDSSGVVAMPKERVRIEERRGRVVCSPSLAGSCFRM